MNWVDAVLIVLLVVFIWAGTYRGLIMEIVDILTVVGGFIIATHLYFYGAVFLKMIFRNIPMQTASTISFLAFFVIFGILIMLAGAALELANKIPIAGIVNKFFGGIFATLKGFLLLWATVVLVNLAPLNDVIRDAMNSSPSVKILTWLNPLLDVLFQLTASADAYKVIHSVIGKSQF